MNERKQKRLPVNSWRFVFEAAALVSILCMGTADAQTSCSEGHFMATYEDDRGQKFSRCENAPINNDWKGGGPQSGGTGDGKQDAGGKRIGPDRFRAIWKGGFRFDASTYLFSAEADDGIRVWIDDVPLIDNWFDGPVARFEKRRWMSGGVHQIRVEYYENTGLAVAKFSWRKL